DGIGSGEDTATSILEKGREGRLVRVVERDLTEVTERAELAGVGNAGQLPLAVHEHRLAALAQVGPESNRAVIVSRGGCQGSEGATRAVQQRRGPTLAGEKSLPSRLQVRPKDQGAVGVAPSAIGKAAEGAEVAGVVDGGDLRGVPLEDAFAARRQRG